MYEYEYEYAHQATQTNSELRSLVYQRTSSFKFGEAFMLEIIFIYVFCHSQFEFCFGCPATKRINILIAIRKHS